ncbi:MAG: FAD-linked oxidase C-terminal domain-containing protein [Polyangia bacterium]|jgi:glycolate oxidase|nr:FAD-linked oxidase C-terminal domain-containing protein [Polyangia bacterium]
MRVDIGHLLSLELGSRVVTEPEALQPFGRDESPLGAYLPEAVVRPTTPEEIRIALRLCAANQVPVTPRGGGTGKTGGALPVMGGVVLSLDQMNKIYEVDRRDQVAVVEPGVVTGVLQQAVESEGLYYPPDPASLDSCTIGGNVANNAGGPRAYRYGVTRDFVLGLELALMGGDRLALGRRSPKGVSGYDLTALVVGSEGTLGVIDRVTLRLLPKPVASAALLGVFDGLGKAGEAVMAISQAGLRPAALELMDGSSLRHIQEVSAYRFPEGAQAVLLVDLEGSSESLEPDLLRAGQALEAAGASDVRLATDEAQRRRLWEARRKIPERLKELHPHKFGDDIAVPLGEMPAMMEAVSAIGARVGLDTAVFGHAGDGNLHVNFLSDAPPDERPRIEKAIERARAALFHETLHRGGTLSGEHGIGLTKRNYMRLEHPPQELEMMRSLKRLFDPLGLMNPGKLLPEPDRPPSRTNSG